MPRCRLSIVPRGFTPHIGRRRFLHVRMASDLPSTGRRYPQLLITSARSPEADEVETASELVTSRITSCSCSSVAAAAGEFVTHNVPNSYRPYVANIDLVLAPR